MKNKLILLVDDDEDDRLFFIEAMTQCNPSISCVVAENGFEALEKLHSSITLPDLIFLDINMPVMNGVECLKKLMQSDLYSQIPVIMYTTTSLPEVREECLRFGASDFIVKPSHYSKVCDEIKRVHNNLLCNSDR